MKIKCFIALCISLYSSLSFSFCNGLDFQNIPSIVDLTSDVTQRIDFNVVRPTSSGDCRYRVGVDRGSAADYNRKLFAGSNTLDFTLAKNQSFSKIIMDIPDAPSRRNYYQARIRNNDPSSKSHNVHTNLVVPQNQPAGTYQDTFLFKLYQRTNGNNYPLYATKSAIFRYTIPEVISISLVASNAPFDNFDTSEDLSFGVITSGAQRNFDIVIQSNGGYVLNISSQNNGTIQHLDPGVNSSIGYTFNSNGSPVSLAGSSTNPVTISTNTGMHPSDGFRIPIQVIMGNVQNKLAGSYRDDLTVTVTTNL